MALPNGRATWNLTISLAGTRYEAERGRTAGASCRLSQDQTERWQYHLVDSAKSPASDANWPSADASHTAGHTLADRSASSCTDAVDKNSVNKNKNKAEIGRSSQLTRGMSVT